MSVTETDVYLLKTLFKYRVDCVCACVSSWQVSGMEIEFSMIFIINIISFSFFSLLYCSILFYPIPINDPLQRGYSSIAIIRNTFMLLCILMKNISVLIIKEPSTFYEQMYNDRSFVLLITEEN